MVNRAKQVVDVINIYMGIIHLIDPYGSVKEFRQRGIRSLSPSELERALKNGLLSSRVSDLLDLPSNYVLRCEDEIIMGKPKSKFVLPKVLRD